MRQGKVCTADMSVTQNCTANKKKPMFDLERNEAEPGFAALEKKKS